MHCFTWMATPITTGTLPFHTSRSKGQNAAGSNFSIPLKQPSVLRNAACTLTLCVHGLCSPIIILYAGQFTSVLTSCPCLPMFFWPHQVAHPRSLSPSPNPASPQTPISASKSTPSPDDLGTINDFPGRSQVHLLLKVLIDPICAPSLPKCSTTPDAYACVDFATLPSLLALYQQPIPQDLLRLINVAFLTLNHLTDPVLGLQYSDTSQWQSWQPRSTDIVLNSWGASVLNSYRPPGPVSLVGAAAFCVD